MQTVHRPFVIVLPLLAWLLLALRVCAGGADDHATAAPEQVHHREALAGSGPAADSDCHSAAWVSHERGASDSRTSLEASGSTASARIWAVLDRAPMAGTKGAVPQPADAPPRLYLLHAALLI